MNSSFTRLRTLLAASLLAGALSAQTATPSSIGTQLRPITPTDPSPAATPTFELTLKWNAKNSDILTIPIRNDFGKPITILGVQATGGIYVCDYPGMIAAKQEETLGFVYSAPDNSDSNVEVIRVLTEYGPRDFQIRFVREEAVQLDVRELKWVAGDATTTKTVVVKLAAGTVLPTKVRATGGHQAVLTNVDATTWQVRVTPASTKKSGKFAVFLEFDRPLPGRAVVILGEIQPRE